MNPTEASGWGELRDTGPMRKLPAMRDPETIDSELRLLAAVRWSIREHGGEPSSRQVDEKLVPRSASSDLLSEV
jgi:hypothetical protein